MYSILLKKDYLMVTITLLLLVTHIVLFYQALASDGPISHHLECLPPSPALLKRQLALSLPAPLKTALNLPTMPDPLPTPR